MLETIALKLLLAVAEEEETTSTVTLATKVGVSQQSVSRVLQELAREELIRKRPLATGLRITLTPKGRLALHALGERLGRALGSAKTGGRLHGIVEAGLGEGKYYLSMQEYRKALQRLLGKEPYLGTLNVRVSRHERELFLAGLHCTEIAGFKTQERTYGGVKFYPVSVAGHKVGLIVPVRTTHGPAKVELVAPLRLRSFLKVKDGDEIIIEERT